MNTSFWSTFGMTIVIAVLAIATLAAAVTLQLTSNEADKAWAAFALLIAYFVGVHTPTPDAVAASTNTTTSANP